MNYTSVNFLVWILNNNYVRYCRLEKLGEGYFLVLFFFTTSYKSIVILKLQSYRPRDQISGCQGLKIGGGRELTRWLDGDLLVMEYFCIFLWWKIKVKVIQSCPTLCNPMDTVHVILQARILELVAFPFSRGSSQPRDQTQVSCIAGRFLTS